MPHRSPDPICLACLALVLSMAVADAAMVIGNLSQAPAGEVPVSLGSWQASSVELSGAEDWEIKGVSLRLQESIPNRFLRVCLVGETSFRPDLNKLEVEFETTVDGDSDPNVITFSPEQSSNLILSPGERYWLLVGVAAEDGDQTPSTGLFHWSFAAGAQADGGSFMDWQFGALTASAGTAGSNWDVAATSPYLFAMNALPVRQPVRLAEWRTLNPSGPVDDDEFLSSDPDGNGQIGLEEFAYDRDSSNELSIARKETHLELEFVRWANAPELTVELQTSVDMMNWLPVTGGVATLLSYDQERVRFLLENLGGRQFFRLLVVEL